MTSPLQVVRAVLRPAGFELVEPFDAAWYDGEVDSVPELTPLTRFGRQSALAVLVGSTSSLWDTFRTAYRTRADLRTSADPLDLYTERTVAIAAAEVGASFELRFAHQTQPVVSMLRIARAAGVAHLGPAHLAIHPEHGPWFGLRAVIVFDLPADGLVRRVAPDPCTGCKAPCVGALVRATSNPLPTTGDLGANWKDWLEVRDVCPEGRGARYSDEQIRYHYTKDRSALD